MWGCYSPKSTGMRNISVGTTRTPVLPSGVGAPALGRIKKPHTCDCAAQRPWATRSRAGQQATRPRYTPQQPIGDLPSFYKMPGEGHLPSEAPILGAAGHRPRGGGWRGGSCRQQRQPGSIMAAVGIDHPRWDGARHAFGLLSAGGDAGGAGSAGSTSLPPTGIRGSRAREATSRPPPPPLSLRDL